MFFIVDENSGGWKVRKDKNLEMCFLQSKQVVGEFDPGLESLSYIFANHVEKGTQRLWAVDCNTNHTCERTAMKQESKAPSWAIFHFFSTFPNYAHTMNSKSKYEVNILYSHAMRSQLNTNIFPVFPWKCLHRLLSSSQVVLLSPFRFWKVFGLFKFSFPNNTDNYALQMWIFLD